MPAAAVLSTLAVASAAFTLLLLANGKETSVSRTLGQVVIVLPVMLLVAATASQLGAALLQVLVAIFVLGSKTPGAAGRPALVALSLLALLLAFVPVGSIPVPPV